MSVVIPAWNARDQLRRLLLSLRHSALPGGDIMDVVVADDGSSDGTEGMLAELSVPFDLAYTYLPRTARSGRAAARNAAIARARGDLILMIDADHVVGPDFVAEHLKYHLVHEDLVVIGPRPDLGEGVFDEDRLGEEFDPAAIPPVAWQDPRERLLCEVSQNLNGFASCWHHMFTCNVSVKASHIHAACGFDEEFLGWGLEDSDLGYRLRRNALSFAFNPSAVAYHQRSRMVDAAMYADYARNLEYMVRKYGEPDIAAQQIIGCALNPADRRMPWVEAAKRFEFACRAFGGRLPRQAAYHRLLVDDENFDAASLRLVELSAAFDLLVIDHTPGGRLGALVQGVSSTNELAYFRDSSGADLAAIAERFPAVEELRL